MHMHTQRTTASTVRWLPRFVAKWRSAVAYTDNAGVKGPLYRFNPETTPKEVFERFFGTKNPYEALEGE